MRHKLLIWLALAVALSGSARAETADAEVEPGATQPAVVGVVRKTDVPRALYYEKEIPVITADVLLTSGYLTTYDHPFASVVDFQQADKRAASPGDNIYISKGSKSGVKQGDVFFIYHRSDPVLDPDTGDEAGYIVSMIGLVSVSEVKDTVALARVDRAFNMIFIGDALMPGYDVLPPKMDPDRPLEDKTIEGKIVHVRLSKGRISLGDTVYLDVGRKQGVMESDLFKVFERGKEDDEGNSYGIQKDIGRLLVITVKETTATALVVNSKSEMKMGDRISYVQER